MRFILDVFYGNNLIGTIRQDANQRYFLYSGDDLVKVSKNQKLKDFKSLPYKDHLRLIAYTLDFLSVNCGIKPEEIRMEKSTKNIGETNPRIRALANKILEKHRDQFELPEPTPIHPVDPLIKTDKIIEIIRKENKPMTANEVFEKTGFDERDRVYVASALSRLAARNKIKFVLITVQHYPKKVKAYTTIKDPLKLNDKRIVGKKKRA